MKICIMGHDVELNSDATYLDALNKAGHGFPDSAVAVRIGGETVELNSQVKDGVYVEPLTLRSDEGRRVYERSLLLLLLVALKREFPMADMQVEHSLPQGIYILLTGIKFLSGSMVKRVEDAMREIVRMNLPFERRQVSLKEAIDIFQKQKQDDKVRLLSYRPKDFFNIYRCGQGNYMVENYFYGEMVPSTGYLPVFALELHLPGIILVQPSKDDPFKLSGTEPSPRLAEVFARSERWGEILGCQYVADLNDMIKHGNIREFIRVNEALHEKTISQIADDITGKRPRVILVAGPSSSGKTTFTNRLNIQLRVNGLKPVMISLDNYYRPKKEAPVDENGTPDLESLDALSVDFFNEQLVSLLQGDEVELPVYDFSIGGRREKGIVTRLKDDQPLLIEGIHGLNDRLTYDIPREYKYKIFVSALSQLNLDKYNRIRTTDGRLIRRLTRDYFTRDSSMERTFSMWPSVRRGEDRWIFPFQEEADYIFNTSLSYELAVIKKYLYPLLDEVKPESPHYCEARRIVKFLNYIVDAEVEQEIPPTSILREFIGGNTFY